MRAAFTESPGAKAVLDPNVSPDVAQMFLMYFSAFGVGMTEPVPNWITRAGRRCAEIGMAQLGRALEAHARGEADHHLLMIADLEHLVGRWNESHAARPLRAADLLAHSMTPGVSRYRAMHENAIAGSSPYQQVAIEYEIERLSVDQGPRLLGNIARVLGPASLAGLSFVRDHVQFDVAHTRFNQTILGDVLASSPGALGPLVEAGREAIASYGAFLEDCLGAAKTALA
jgi:hypothetical protein